MVLANSRFEMELQLLLAVSQSEAQYTELERNRSVAMAQHESVALAQIVIEKQRAQEINDKRETATTTEVLKGEENVYADSFESISEIKLDEESGLATEHSIIESISDEAQLQTDLEQLLKDGITQNVTKVTHVYSL
jgi:hypothetical protein